MIKISLPSKAVIEVEKGTTPAEIAKTISVSLAKNVVGAVFNDELIEKNRAIFVDGSLRLLTKDDKEALSILNHSTAHLLAQAISNLYPKAKFGIGPAINEGFYYDIDFGSTSFSDLELENVEREMSKLVSKGDLITRLDVGLEEALRLFANDEYKLEIIEEYKNSQLTVYKQGDFIDLCRGGHLESTSLIKHFKLLSIAGAYWRGDVKNIQLTRIYGTSFFSEKDLTAHLKLLIERKERDHRKIGKEQQIFTIFKEVGSGLPFWLKNGATIRRTIERYIIDKEISLGYEHVYTPIMANVKLYETSGHLSHYQDSMFPAMEFSDGEKLVLRPMNCPHHMLIYGNEVRSYRELPIRIAELGMMHRYEKSGALSGLHRVREMTLNDAHIFVRPDQVIEEFTRAMNLMMEVYHDFNITDFKFRLSYRDPFDKEKYFPNDQMWENAERELKNAMDLLGFEYFEAIGEAAFYGPKVDVQVKTALGNEETLSTVQLDFLLPEKFDLNYVGEDGKNNHRPVVIHRGIVSTMERFVAYLIEEYKGVFPTWLAPVMVKVLPVNLELHQKYANKVVDLLRKKQFRVEADYREEKLGYKIRDAQVNKIPFQLVIGDNEIENNAVTYREYGSQKQVTVSLSEFASLLAKRVKSKC